ncbi:hypothetical protein CIHG_05299 [Coccidioides immitis H538.4]|uniref:Uncharacterized protein n=2 Tax=Coccidioides immitis TaxID=5501 RepID=A0A0J8R0L7_COCIT|nr:hypothetical protein CISG_01724 [Coccidioides immitis RMSCC 3703]KMU87503.1 hypothetical protein CIHG_05299 [Coccidioides immitis H538.4]
MASGGLADKFPPRYKKPRLTQKGHGKESCFSSPPPLFVRSTPQERMDCVFRMIRLDNFHQGLTSCEHGGLNHASRNHPKLARSVRGKGPYAWATPSRNA